MTRVDTTSGPIVGEHVGSLHRFLGVPYAAPPVGPRRFRHPTAHDGWTVPRPATVFGPSAPQVVNTLDGLVPGMGVDRTNEDCLTLNVWTPDPTGQRAMLVWFHGGAFSLGGSAQPNYDGTLLSERGDVVVVSCNYRLGALGFLAADGVDPNCGIADQVAALRWLKANAAGFGADPDLITIFGESAGGGSVLSVLTSPESTGLVRRAIVQSGASNQFLHRAAAEQVATAFLEAADVAEGDLDALVDLDVEAVLSAQAEASTAVLGTVGVMPWHPTDDGAFLPHDWFTAFELGAADGIDLLIGTTRDEMNLFASFDPAAASLDEDALRQRLAFLHADADADTVMAAYRSVYGDPSPPEIWAQALTDTSMWAPCQRILTAREGASGATYAYRFDWSAADAATGACHGIDIPFPFDTVDVAGWDGFLADVSGARTLAQRIQAAWAAFAATGDPSTTTLRWPQYEPADRTTMVLDADPHPVDDPAGPIRTLWLG